MVGTKHTISTSMSSNESTATQSSYQQSVHSSPPSSIGSPHRLSSPVCSEYHQPVNNQKATPTQPVACSIKCQETPFPYGTGTSLPSEIQGLEPTRVQTLQTRCQRNYDHYLQYCCTATLRKEYASRAAEYKQKEEEHLSDWVDELSALQHDIRQAVRDANANAISQSM